MTRPDNDCWCWYDAMDGTRSNDGQALRREGGYLLVWCYSVRTGFAVAAYAHARYDPVSGKKAPDAVIIQKVASDELQVAFSPDCSVAGAAGERVRLARPIGSTIRPIVVFRLQTIIKKSFGL
ncbi:hypothetical protein AM588_10000134 [Phytophthora nicotianae]|uniref:Uncharacterized protein n=1 Tax=Phytophthora nicotianae TaxID=4792 RepID=A0A0W8C619_PHYNI|nr:hypothetical protein AM588_10000134 [Phytophthora nicotianae]